MIRPTLALATLGIALVGPAAHAQEATPVQKIMANAAAAYRNAPQLSMVIETVSGDQKTTTQLALARSGKLAATIVQGDVVRHVVADGTTAFTDVSTSKAKYIKYPGKTLAEALSALGQSRGTGVGLLPILLTSPAAEKQIIPGKPTLVKQEEDQTVDGVPCNIITATYADQGEKTVYRFAIGKADSFLRQLTITPEGKPAVVTETYTKINPNPTLTAATFTYVPAAGAVASEPPKAPPMFDPRLKVGADPFALVGKDLADKTVSYADYKGKVLLVDFWATWCGPCVAELPNVLAAYGKYHDQGFEILGISLDREGDRPKLESFIKEKNMPWRQVYDGKFWKAANAVNYGVQAIPFTLLIGKDGKIAAVGARGEDLAPAIEAALKK